MTAEGPRRVFVGASFPSGEQGDDVRPYWPGEIAVAVASCVEAVLRSGAKLVFGGHPTITPMVAQISRVLGATDQVELWQSLWFGRPEPEPGLTGSDEAGADRDPDDAGQLERDGATVLWVPADRDVAVSVGELRARMLATPLDCGFLVGGMAGLYDEFRLLRAAAGAPPVHAFTGPGGAAAIIAADLPIDRRLEGRAYGTLTLRALRGEPGTPERSGGRE